jgi:hypothetical protein
VRLLLCRLGGLRGLGNAVGTRENGLGIALSINRWDVGHCVRHACKAAERLIVGAESVVFVMRLEFAIARCGRGRSGWC